MESVLQSTHIDLKSSVANVRPPVAETGTETTDETNKGHLETGCVGALLDLKRLDDASKNLKEGE